MRSLRFINVKECIFGGLGIGKCVFEGSIFFKGYSCSVYVFIFEL